MFDQLKLKRQLKKKIENTKICYDGKNTRIYCYWDLNFDTNSLNETDLLN